MFEKINNTVKLTNTAMNPKSYCLTFKIIILMALYLSLNTEGSATEAEATASKVKKINIRFTAGTELKEAIAKAQFTDASTLSNK